VEGEMTNKELIEKLTCAVCGWDEICLFNHDPAHGYGCVEHLKTAGKILQLPLINGKSLAQMHKESQKD
jgi:hypothetical protein